MNNNKPQKQDEATGAASELNAGLDRAARAVVREALDNVDVHPCDEHNDEVRGSKLYGPMRELYEALRSNE